MSPASKNRKSLGVFLGIGLAVLGVLLGSTLLAQSTNPVPLINQPLVPDATAPGGPQFTLTINGTGFVSNSTVNWNTTPLATTFVGASQLTAVVPAADIATASTGWVTVVNPKPGGGTSNTAFLTVTPAVANALGFGLVSSLNTGYYAESVAVGDFNGDGKLDLAVVTGDPDAVSVLLGDGTGNFTLASTLAVGIEPMSVAVGDFNGDGKLDLAVANYFGSDPNGLSPGTVSILLGDGTGNFTLDSTPGTGYYPTSVAAGDFNGDGKLDLAVANSEGTVSILLGDGTGNFTLASSPAAGEAPWSVAVGDFNGDGKLDLAVTNIWTSAVSILLGDGTGNFTLTSSPATGTQPGSVAVGDFNGDGKLDLAVANSYSGTLSILLGDGTGNFTLASSPAAGVAPWSVAVGDFNADGKLDLVVANNSAYAGAGSASILLGDGTGNFTMTSSQVAGVEPLSVAVGDFNGDGKLDVAVADYGVPSEYYPGTVSVLLQDVPVATVSTSSLSFGTQLIGTTSASQSVTLSSTGGATLNITSIVASRSFAQSNNCGPSLAVGASCTITVTFGPRGLGTFAGSVTITDNGFGSPQTVTLTGAGTEVTLSPSTLHFETQTVGTTSAPQTITMTNSGYRPLIVAVIYVAGDDTGDFTQTNTCGTRVPAGSSCTISVTFTPQARGPRRAFISVSDNGGGAPQTVALKGYGM